MLVGSAVMGQDLQGGVAALFSLLEAILRPSKAYTLKCLGILDKDQA